MSFRAMPSLRNGGCGLDLTDLTVHDEVDTSKYMHSVRL